MAENTVKCTYNESLLLHLRPELLRGAYFNDPAFIPGVTFGRPSVQGRVLSIPVAFPAAPKSDRNWQGPQPCPAGEHIWDRHDTRETTVQDVPLGAHQTSLRVTRVRYRCRQKACTSKITPWPPGLLASSASDNEATPLRITERLLEFTLEQWSSGLTFDELRDLTGLSRMLITRIIDMAPVFLAALPAPERVPRVIGIDEIYLHKRYYTVISDLSKPGKTRLIDIAWGRDGWSPEHTRKSPRLIEVPPQDAVRLSGVVRDLAERSLAESKLRGHEWIFPIVTADGWTAFRRTLQRVIRQVATANKVKSPPQLTYFPDIWHLKRGLILEERKARSLLDHGAKSQEANLRGQLRRLFALNRDMNTHQSKRRRREATREFWTAEAAFNNEINELGLPANCRWTTDLLMPRAGKASQNQVTAARIRHESRIMDEIKRLHAAGLQLIKAVQDAGNAMFFARKDPHELGMQWRKAIMRFDEHPFTRLPDGGFAFSQFDVRWSHNRSSDETLAESTMLRTAASSWNIVLQDDVAKQLTPGSPTAKEVTELSGMLDANQWFVSADAHPELHARIVEINEVTRVMLAKEVFLLTRPTNSRTERLNREIRAVLRRSENLNAASYTRLRSRLLLRFSGRFLPSRSRNGAVPIIHIPPECSGCGSSDLAVSDSHYEESCLGVPAGWRPVRYSIRSQAWTCKACGSASPGTPARRKAVQSDALTAYLQHVASQPRLGPLPLRLWQERTGAPLDTLRPLLTGYVLEKDEPAEGLARVIGLAMTSKTKQRNRSGTYRNYSENEKLAAAHENNQPRILILNLRHGIAPTPDAEPQTPNGKSKNKQLKPPRLMAHDRMDIHGLIERLGDAHEKAGAELKVVLNRRMHRFAEELQAASQGRWLLLTDLHSVLPAVTRTAVRAYNHWKYGTYMTVPKLKRTHRNPFEISPGRATDEETMDRLMVKELLRPLNPHEVQEFERIATWHEGMVTGKDYHQEDTPLIRHHLHTWRRLLLSFDPITQKEFAIGTQELLQSPPRLESASLRVILEEFHQEMQLLIPLLQNSIPGSTGDPVPNTRKGVYNTGQLGAVLHQLLHHDSQRGFRRT